MCKRNCVKNLILNSVLNFKKFNKLNFNVLLVEVLHYFVTIFDSCNKMALKIIEIRQSFNNFH